LLSHSFLLYLSYHYWLLIKLLSFCHNVFPPYIQSVLFTQTYCCISKTTNVFYQNNFPFSLILTIILTLIITVIVSLFKHRYWYSLDFTLRHCFPANLSILIIPEWVDLSSFLYQRCVFASTPHFLEIESNYALNECGHSNTIIISFNAKLAAWIITPGIHQSFTLIYCCKEGVLSCINLEVWCHCVSCRAYY